MCHSNPFFFGGRAHGANQYNERYPSLIAYNNRIQQKLYMCTYYHVNIREIETCESIRIFLEFLNIVDNG